jgi:hypothetical protein
MGPQHFPQNTSSSKCCFSYELPKCHCENASNSNSGCCYHDTLGSGTTNKINPIYCCRPQGAKANITTDAVTGIRVSCGIFKHFALQVDPVIGFIQPRSTPFQDKHHLVPKLADPHFWWKSNSTPSKSGSGLPNPDELIFCTI